MFIQLAGEIGVRMAPTEIWPVTREKEREEDPHWTISCRVEGRGEERGGKRRGGKERKRRVRREEKGEIKPKRRGMKKRGGEEEEEERTLSVTRANLSWSYILLVALVVVALVESPEIKLNSTWHHLDSKMWH